MENNGSLNLAIAIGTAFTDPSTSAFVDSVTSTEDPTENHIAELPLLHTSDEDRALLYLRYYARHFIPIFCLVGIVGNCMALMLIRTNYWLRRLTSNIYLCTLSICGCLFLSTVMVTWLDSTFTHTGIPPLYSNSEIGCKMLTFTAHSCDFICVWMISWVSCDRAIVLFRPGIRRRVCSKSFARNLVICTVLFSSTLYGWCLVFAGLEPLPDGTSFCGLKSEIELAGYNLRELHIFFSLLDTILCTVVPSLLIMVVNSLSIYRYRQCMKIYSSGVLRVRFLRVPESEGIKMMEETTTAKKFLLSQQSQTTTNQLSTATSSRSTTGGKLKSSDLTLSRSLLIVTSTFVLLNVPNYAFRLYEAVFNVEQTDLWQFLFFMTYLLYYLHHAVLFYMYIFWSPQMKKQLMPTALKLLECYCFKTVPEFGHHSQVSLQAVRQK
ncbi:7 transmembrane receptor (rhodopsin family) domain-containing protein [Ditylenchus destructor]|uniref:7 transmembrane receptor (Rhodopsin family) domain-containing protein n=1 Tax=Ditylenchus destructor TaxID=166010 RepID=A0AAD4NBS2_9BILA|nr:7 transmembrane receptor (rhodopsin family) domain-containing protein [Ditylenchus destructor]